MSRYDTPVSPGTTRMRAHAAALIAATMAEYEPNTRWTVRDVSRVTGLTLTTTHNALLNLAEEGLVSWPTGSHGALRLACSKVKVEL